MIEQTYAAIEKDKWQILGYFLLSISLSGLTGLLLKASVRTTELDRKHKLFRYRNEWHYLFRGEYLDFPGVPGKSLKVKMTYIDLLVSSPEGDIIYSGLLAEYVLGIDGGLDRLYVHNAKRRYLLNDVPPSAAIEASSEGAQNRYYHFPGTVLMIPYAQVKNLNVRFITLIDEPVVKVQPEAPDSKHKDGINAGSDAV